MSSNCRTDGADDESGGAGLDRAAAALRDAVIPAGPSPAVRERTLAALTRGNSQHRWGTSPGAPWRIAAALFLAAGAAAAAFLALGRPGNPVVAGPGRQTTPATTPAPGAGTGTGRLPDAALDPGSGSMITGEIRYDGDAPAPQLINFGSSPTCGEHRHGPLYDDSLVVNLDNTLQNVVVSVVAGLPEGRAWPAPDAPVRLDQTGCSYQPHVLAMRAGQRVLVRNSDSILHNTRSLSSRNPEFNIAQPQSDPGCAVPSPAAPEFFQVRCDIHPWMTSWFCVFNHPWYDVSGANGTFTLPRLPPGRYRLRAWHEKLGVRERDVVVQPGRDETINFVFRAPPGDRRPGRAADDGRPGATPGAVEVASGE